MSLVSSLLREDSHDFKTWNKYKSQSLNNCVNKLLKGQVHIFLKYVYSFLKYVHVTWEIIFALSLSITRHDEWISLSIIMLPLENHMEMSTLILLNTWNCYINFNSFNLYVTHCEMPTSSCSHTPSWHGTKENVPPSFSSIKSLTQTLHFLLCHLLWNLALSLVSLFPGSSSSLPAASSSSAHFTPCKYFQHLTCLSNYMFFYSFFNRKLLERLFNSQWIPVALSCYAPHKHSTEDVHTKVPDA